jgi:5-methylcytosine-specific restriction endonuclease McrA
VTPSATVRGGRQETWTRDRLIDALRRYAELYGPAFTASAFSPSTAKWRDDDDETVERYYRGDPVTGEPWPSLNAIKSKFGGSFNEARVAAGLPANRPGPSRRKRPDGAHRPVRDVSHANATRTVFVEKKGVDDERVAALERRLELAQQRARRLEEALERSRAARRARPKAKTVRVGDASAARARDRAVARLAEAREALQATRKEVTEARSAATRMASRLERAESTISELRAERRELREAATAADDRRSVAERMLAEASEDVERMREDAARPRVVVRDAPEREAVDAALREAREAGLRERDALLRAGADARGDGRAAGRGAGGRRADGGGAGGAGGGEARRRPGAAASGAARGGVGGGVVEGAAVTAVTEDLKRCPACAAMTRGFPAVAGGPLLCVICGRQLPGRGERRAAKRRRKRKARATVQGTLEAYDRRDFEEYKRYPLGRGMPLGRPLREDGETHRDAWKALLRRDPCAYCGRVPSGTVDHVVPSKPRKGDPRGREEWVNYAGACERCNVSKGNEKLLFFLLRRVNVPRRFAGHRTPFKRARVEREGRAA